MKIEPQSKSPMTFLVLICGLVLAGFGWQSESRGEETKIIKKSEASVPAAGDEAKDDFSSEGENKDVEDLYDKTDQSDKQKTEAKKRVEAAKPKELKDVSSLGELSGLAPFSDVAVIQRRFLPRTQRFEMSLSGMTTINNPFFNNLGLALRGDYYFSEKHGIEAQYMYFSNTSRSVTDSLIKDRGVVTSNLVTVKNYFGAAYKWTPYYGKISFLNQHIVPFDLYFTGGLGLSQTTKKSEPTLHLSTGQTFAMSKSFAVRWDLVWNYYQATADSASGSGETKTNHSDLFLSIGASFFVPEATYR